MALIWVLVTLARQLLAQETPHSQTNQDCWSVTHFPKFRQLEGWGVRGQERQGTQLMTYGEVTGLGFLTAISTLCTQSGLPFFPWGKSDFM